jgi:hypothetical protein
MKFKNNWENIALFNAKGDLESAKALFIKSDSSVFELSNTLNELSSKEWMTETVTVFTQKGLGAGSKDAEIEKLHPAPFSFQDVGRLIKYFLNLVYENFNFEKTDNNIFLVFDT